MSNTRNQNKNDDILDIYRNFKGYDGKPIIEDLEPGVIYGFETGNRRAVHHIEIENTAVKRNYFWSGILNVILLATIIGICIFASIKFVELNNEFVELSEKYDEMHETYNTSQVFSTALTTKVHLVSQNIGQIMDHIPEETEIDEVDDSTNPELEKYSFIPLDDSLKSYIYQKAIENNIPPEMLFSIAWKESSYNANAKSTTNDHGLFQINECNFADLSKKFGWSLEKFWNNIYDPYVNTDCAVIILKDCRDKYNNDNWHHVLMRYNLGPSRTNEFFADGIYSTKYSRATVNYAAKTFGFTDIELR